MERKVSTGCCHKLARRIIHTTFPAAGTKPEKKPFARGTHGVANAAWTTEWFYGEGSLANDSIKTRRVLRFGRTYAIQKVKLDHVANSGNDAVGRIRESFIDGNLNVVGHTEGGGGSRSEQKECADGLHLAGVDVWANGSRKDSCGSKQTKARGSTVKGKHELFRIIQTRVGRE